MSLNPYQFVGLKEVEVSAGHCTLYIRLGLLGVPGQIPLSSGVDHPNLWGRPLSSGADTPKKPTYTEHVLSKYTSLGVSTLEFKPKVLKYP